MNRLPIEKRAQIIGLLVEGMSMRAVTRITGVSINTVSKLLEDVGLAANLYQAQALGNLPCKRVQCDEIWAFCYSKEKNVAPAEKGVLGFGDVWTWTAICADTKLIASYMVGKRTAEYAHAFMNDLSHRLVSRIQLTTDGNKAYLDAVPEAFREIDYAMLVKIYGEGPKEDRRRYSPSDFVRAEKRVVSGSPDLTQASTSYVERQNLTMRMGMRRFTRLTNGFSKKVENLEHAVSLHFLHYNFARIHKTLRVTPAMAAGISDHVWSLEEIANLAA
ncbi:IS1 family transposase [uncultured Methylibium sp.]|uniref:IS1 family transposase n=1 Tax=uncultured Methylibium sp. TaxID=381093 RepID=UPI0025F99A64|nr:IS1 family transposase [uncultured Methylibium sp.]